LISEQVQGKHTLKQVNYKTCKVNNAISSTTVPYVSKELHAA